MHKILQKIALLIGISALMISVHSTYAIGASPLRVEYEGIPGETIKGQVTVFNTSEEAVLHFMRYGLILTPGTAFQDENPNVRLCFSFASLSQR